MGWAGFCTWSAGKSFNFNLLGSRPVIPDLGIQGRGGLLFEKLGVSNLCSLQLSHRKSPVIRIFILTRERTDLSLLQECGSVRINCERGAA